VLAGLVLLAALSGCIGPARTTDDYRRKASTSLQDTGSAVESARLAVDAAARDRATGPYLAVLLGKAEEQATSVQSTFDSVQPPDHGADRLRHEVDGLLGEAVSVLADLRIAARRDDSDAIIGNGAPLEDLSGRLRQLEDRLG